MSEMSDIGDVKSVCPRFIINSAPRLRNNPFSLRKGFKRDVVRTLAQKQSIIRIC